MHTTTTTLLALLITLTTARFNQEQLPIPAIRDVTSGGAPGVAATLAGSAISTLLGAANPCAKLQKADDIITQLGTGADAIAAAIGLVAAEQNTNPFVVDRPFICGDPTLPKTEVLRGITPLVDPATERAAVARALSEKSKVTPLDAKGKSVAQVMADNGFANLVAKDLQGNVVQLDAAPSSGQNDVQEASEGGNATAVTSQEPASTATLEGSATTVVSEEPAGNATVVATTDNASTTAACEAAVSTFITVTRDAASASASASASTVESSAFTNFNATTASTSTAPTETISSETPAVSDGTDTETPDDNNSVADGVDFGDCTPTIDFLPGRNGRKATEFTFQATDPVVNKGQQEALNPNIITNRICDQLTNVCKANQAAKDLCQRAKATVLASGLKDDSVVETWNALLGFPGAVAAVAAIDSSSGTGNTTTGGSNSTASANVDFGRCTPTIDFLPGRNGRKATEFTFQATDPVVNKGQQEALNPNIITNRICDQLTNVCEANQAAKDLCQQAKAQVLASGKRDASVVGTWNGLLGF